jgi:hypothetical protein
MQASFPYTYLDDLGSYVAQHDELGIDDTNHQFTDLRVEQDQVHHSIDDLETFLIDGCQFCQVVDHA